MKLDIQIAQECVKKPIREIYSKLGIDEDYIEQYGKYKAKIDLKYLKESKNKDGKLVLVTAITPTPAGEGKTEGTGPGCQTQRPYVPDRLCGGGS